MALNFITNELLRGLARVAEGPQGTRALRRHPTALTLPVTNSLLK